MTIESAKLLNLPGEGYRVRIPVTTWQTWKGMEIEGTGVTPDIPIDFCAEESAMGNDVQLTEAVKFLNQRSRR